MNKVILAAAVICTMAARPSAAHAEAADPFIEGLRAIYIASGVPADGSGIDRNTSDVKFQVRFGLLITPGNCSRLSM